MAWLAQTLRTPWVATMTAALPQICEVKIGEAWQAVSLHDAHGRYRPALKRCPACHGAVYIMGAYIAGRRFTLAHRKPHNGCPLVRRGYSGVPSLHPEPLT